MWVPIWVLNNSPAKCCGVPLPAEAKLKSVLGFLVNATNSLTVLTPTLGLTSSTSGKEEIWITGARSTMGLKVMVLYSVGFTAMGPLAASSKV